MKVIKSNLEGENTEVFNDEKEHGFLFVETHDGLRIQLNEKILNGERVLELHLDTANAQRLVVYPNVTNVILVGSANL